MFLNAMTTYLDDSSWNKTDGLQLFGLLLLCAILTGMTLNIGGFWWTDESRHAMDGVYLYDVLRELPLANLYQYTEEYFVRFPALGLTWYLPFFAFIESIVFNLFGISEFSARLTVLLFALLGVLVWYLLARNAWGRSVAFLSSLILITHPIYMYWGRSVMLEVPLVTMMILAFASFDGFLKSPTFKRSFIAGVAIFAMVLTKQTSLFLFPPLLIYALFQQSFKTLFRKEVLPAYLLTGLALAVVYIHARKFGVNAFGGDNRAYDYQALFSVERWTMCARVIYQAYTLPVLLLAATGILTIAVNKKRNAYDALILAWLVFWYLAITIVISAENNVLRYTTYLAPVLALLASRSFFSVDPKKPIMGYVAFSTAILVAIWNVVVLSDNDQPYVDGYRKAAQFIHNHSVAAPVLFCCKHDGNFIFNLRVLDSERNHIVLRADKVMVSMAVHKHFGVKSYVENKNDILTVLDQYGVGYIVSEDHDLVGMEEFELLIDTLKGDEFELVKSFALDTNVDEFKDTNIHIYRYLQQKPIGNDEIVIPMPHLKREIRLKLGDKK